MTSSAPVRSARAEHQTPQIEPRARWRGLGGCAAVIKCNSFAFDDAGDYGLLMAESSPIPLTYAQWRECITIKCRIQLTRAYLEDRIASLADPETGENRSFRRLYGEAHYQAVRRWFQKALDELPPQLN